MGLFWSGQVDNDKTWLKPFLPNRSAVLPRGFNFLQESTGRNAKLVKLIDDWTTGRTVTVVYTEDPEEGRCKNLSAVQTVQTAQPDQVGAILGH